LWSVLGKLGYYVFYLNILFVCCCCFSVSTSPESINENGDFCIEYDQRVTYVWPKSRPDDPESCVCSAVSIGDSNCNCSTSYPVEKKDDEVCWQHLSRSKNNSIISTIKEELIDDVPSIKTTVVSSYMVMINGK